MDIETIYTAFADNTRLLQIVSDFKKNADKVTLVASICDLLKMEVPYNTPGEVSTPKSERNPETDALFVRLTEAWRESKYQTYYEILKELSTKDLSEYQLEIFKLTARIERYNEDKPSSLLFETIASLSHDEAALMKIVDNLIAVSVGTELAMAFVERGYITSSVCTCVLSDENADHTKKLIEKIRSKDLWNDATIKKILFEHTERIIGSAFDDSSFIKLALYLAHTVDGINKILKDDLIALLVEYGSEFLEEEDKKYLGIEIATQILIYALDKNNQELFDEWLPCGNETEISKHDNYEAMKE